MKYRIRLHIDNLDIRRILVNVHDEKQAQDIARVIAGIYVKRCPKASVETNGSTMSSPTDMSLEEAILWALTGEEQ